MSHAIPKDHQQAFHFTPGRHYVVYSDGSVSRLMPEQNARDYAKIFGGEVYSKPSKLSRLLKGLLSWFLTVRSGK